MDMISKLVSFMNQKSDVYPSNEPHEYFNSDTSSLNHVSEASLNTQNSSRKKINSKLSVLKLNFTVKRKHLKMTEGGLSLKCTAEVLDLYWRSSEVETQVTSLPGTWSMPSFSNSVAIYIRSLSVIIFEAVVLFIIFI